MTNSDATNRFCDDPQDDESKEGMKNSASNGSRSRSRRKRSRSLPETSHDSDATLGSKTPPVEPPCADPLPTHAAEQESPLDSARYQTLGEVGRGGWGIVERAVDRQLDREVAVKRFTDCSDVTEEERQRFLHEARVTSQLQHPGIVPVHEMGDRQDAFYVMKLLDGVTFRDFIEDHHKKLPTRKRNRYQFGESLEPLLQRFVDICNAVAYAHKRGVVHRDLKPSNVMISGFGETVVLDWGLATSQHCDGDASPDTEAVVDAKRKSKRDLLADPEGTVVGTPAFMSPEQAAGDVSSINQASDIYSLGVILYTVIAGQSPYQGQSVNAILEQVKSASYARIRSTQPLTPSPLVSIVEKAMAASQVDRYATAEQLASDVRRFIAGDSVSAHRENLAERSLRWCRHHQGISASIAGSVTVLLLASIGFGIVIKRAHRAEQRARIDAQRAHREAVLSLTEARDATDTWLLELSGSLQFYPGMEKLRADLLERAIDQYERITDQSLETAQARRRIDLLPNKVTDVEAASQLTQDLALLERAKAALRLGDLFRLKGNALKASEYYFASKEILTLHNGGAARPSIAAAGETIHQQVQLELVNALIGQLLISPEVQAASPSHVEVASARRWTRSLIERIIADSSDESQLDPFAARVASACVRIELATQRAISALPSSDWEQDKNDYLRAIEVARWLTARRGTVGDRRLSETVQTDLCQRLTEQGQHRAALETWSQLIGDLTAWSAADTERMDYLQSLASALLYRGNCFVALGDQPNAISDFEASIQKLEHAWQMTDHDGYFRANLATAQNNLGQLLALGEQRDPVLASRLLCQSLRSYEALLREELTTDRLRRFALTHYALAMLEDEVSQPAEHSTEGRADHATKASDAFEIVSDYEALTIDEQFSWVQCQIFLTQHHQRIGAYDSATQQLTAAQQTKNMIATRALPPDKRQLLDQLQEQLTRLETLLSQTQLIDTTPIIDPDSIQ